MSTAVIITGHMRTFATCVHTIKWHVLRHYSDPAFYVSTVRDEDAESYKILHELFPGAPVRVDIVDEQPQLEEPPEPVRFEPYARSVPLQAVLRQLWQLERGWQLYERNCRETEDQIIRVRPDLFFHSFKHPGTVAGVEAITPAWGRFGGVNDRFAVLGVFAARHYFTTFGKLARLQSKGCPLHPESLVMASLEDGQCNHEDILAAEFTTYRKDGSHRPPEFSPVDFLHAALG